LKKLIYSKSLEDGRIIIGENAIYQECPKCYTLVPKVYDNLALFDIRNCIQGFVDIKTGIIMLPKTCKVCKSILK
jgi:hypothetical protein